eukprot:GEMP01043746.1.p1 GENE.GEMP01043746.1~~GEMP01043746.1.p1  ORF type:complete len:214 (+),score=13.03 GEMP01043746.1:115-756(+)
MIQARKALCITGFHLKSLNIRNAELDYFLMVFDRLSQISSLLAGFASSALMVGIPRRQSPFLVSSFLIVTGSALGSHLLVVIVATMCTMWGPGKVLRGRDVVSVNYAITILERYLTTCIRFFIFGLTCYFVSSILVVWLLFNLRGCIIITIVYAILTSWLFQKSVVIYTTLNPDAKMVSGRLRGNPVKNVGELMGDATLDGRGGVSAAFATHI